MDEELSRLIDAIIDNSSCYLCGSPIQIGSDDLEQESRDLYVSEYYCSGCDVGYDIEIWDGDDSIELQAYRMDFDDSDPAQMFRNTRKEDLHRESHPARELVENTMELSSALEILFENRERIQELCNILRQDGFEQDDDFHRCVRADLHNFMASAYSFQQIVENIEPDLPTGGDIESAWHQFEDEHQIIKGLRTYAQHNLTLPYAFSHFLDENTEQMEKTITIPLEEVTEFNYGDQEISFEKVEGDTINVERRVNLLYEAAENLVQEMTQYVQASHEEELEEFEEVTTYDELG